MKDRNLVHAAALVPATFLGFFFGCTFVFCYDANRQSKNDSNINATNKKNDDKTLIYNEFKNNMDKDSSTVITFPNSYMMKNAIK